jgi:hypothetical protein
MRITSRLIVINWSENHIECIRMACQTNLLLSAENFGTQKCSHYENLLNTVPTAHISQTHLSTTSYIFTKMGSNFVYML